MAGRERCTPEARQQLLRRLQSEVQQLSAELRLAKEQTLLLRTVQQMRPLTVAERQQARTLRAETLRLEATLRQYRAEFAALQDPW